MDKNVPFPGWDKVEMERRQDGAKVWLIVKDVQGNVIRKIEGSVKKGFHHIAWDLRYPSVSALNIAEDLPKEEPSGVLAPPGEYTVTLFKDIDGKITLLSGPQTFLVERLREGALKGSTPQETAAFWQRIAKLSRKTSATSLSLTDAQKRVEVLQTVLKRTTVDSKMLSEQLSKIRESLFQLDEKLNGNRSKREIGEDRDPTINSRLGVAMSGTSNSTYGPTPTHIRSMEIAEKEFQVLKAELENILNKALPEFEKSLQAAGAPWIQGQPLPQ